MLSIPSESYLGQTVSCPQCTTPFQLEETASDLLPMADLASPLPEASAPGFPSGASVDSDPGGRSHSTARSGSRKLLWIGGAAGLGILALVLLLVALLRNGPDRGPTELDFMPDNTELLVHLRVREFLVSDLSNNLVQNIPSLRELINGIHQLGIPPMEVETITVGMSGVSLVLDNPDATNPGSVDFTLRLRFYRPVDVDSLVKSFSEQNRGRRDPVKTRLENRPFYVAHAFGTRQPPVALYVIDEKTLLFGVEQSVRKAVSGGGKSRAEDTFEFMDFTQQLLVGFVPHDSSTLDKMMPQPDLNQSRTLQKVFSATRGNLHGVALAINMANEINITILGQFTGGGPAMTCATEITGSIAEMHEQMAGLNKVAKGQQLVATTILEKVLRNVDTGHDGNVAHIHFSVSKTGTNVVLAAIGNLEIPGIGDLFGGDVAMDESPGISADEALSLEDEMTKLVLEGVTEESLAGIKSMFEDPEYILMEYLDRWLTGHIGAAVTITASIDSEEAFVEIAGIDDVEAFAEKIDFATVLEVDKRSNMVTARWRAPDK
jgi:hypothetical protein